MYVSEPQPLAHPSEEVIDMVENPITTDAQVNNQPSHFASTRETVLMHWMDFL